MDSLPDHQDEAKSHDDDVNEDVGQGQVVGDVMAREHVNGQVALKIVAIEQEARLHPALTHARFNGALRLCDSMKT